MRIGIDIRAILSPHYDGNVGGGHYVLHLVKSLLQVDNYNEYFLLCDEKLRHKDRVFFSSFDNVQLLPFPRPFFSKIMPGLYNETFALSFLQKAGLNVLHVPLSSIRIPSGYRGKVVVSVYDLSVYLRPDQFPSIYRTRQKAIKLFNVRKADALIVPYFEIAERVTDIFQFDGSDVHVVSPGVDERFVGVPTEDVEAHKEQKSLAKRIARQYGIRGKYMIAVGTIEPVKNLQRLMHAFALFRDQRRAHYEGDPSDYSLLIVGKLGDSSASIKAFMRDLDLEEHVHFVGYVVGDDIASLLAGADMCVHPALYEGLGLSALESLVSGVPAAFSKIPVHREIAGDNAVYFDPHDTHDIARAMSLLEESGSSKRVDVDRFLELYNWSDCARKTLQVYKSIAE